MSPIRLGGGSKRTPPRSGQANQKPRGGVQTGMLRDIKHALRMFVQSPAFALAAVAALTLGIARQHRDLLGGQRRVAAAGGVAGRRPDRVLHDHRAEGPRVSGARRRRSSRTCSAQTEVTETGVGVQHGRRQLHGRQFPEQLGPAACPRTSSRCSARRPSMGRTFPRRRTVRAATRSRSSAELLADRLQQRSATSSARRCRSAASRTPSIGVLDDFEFARFRSTSRRRCGCRSSSIPNTSDQGHYFSRAAG